jgi:hypothetical protein
LFRVDAPSSWAAARPDGTADAHLAGDLHAADVHPHARQLPGRELVARPAGAAEVGQHALAPRAVLQPPVGHVGLVRADEVVVGVDAARLVAAMAELQPVADAPVAQRPRQPVHAMLPAVQADEGIAVAVAPALPDVAARQRVDLGLGREPLLDRAVGVSAGEGGLGHGRIIRPRPVADLLLSLELAPRWLQLTAGAYFSGELVGSA